MIKIDSIKISAKQKIDIKEYVTSKYCQNSEISNFLILKKSLDARDKSDIKYVYSVSLKTDDKLEKYLLRKYKNISEYIAKPYKVPKRNNNSDSNIVIVGMGPAGLFTALILSEAGFKPVIIDKGKCVEERIKDVEEFFEGGKLDVFSNVQFGEGGAGMGPSVVIDGVGPEADACVGPVDQIRAGGVVPVFQAVYGSPGAPLIVEMPDPVVISEAVGIAGQAGDWLYMEFLTVVRGNDLVVQVNNFICAVQYAVALFASPFSQNDTSGYL